MNLNQIVKHALEEEASAIHFVVGKPPCIRTNHELQQLKHHGKLKTEVLDKLVRELLTSDELTILHKERSILVSSTLFDRGRFRIHVSKQRGTYSVTIQIPKNVEKIKTFEFHQTIDKIHKIKNGLIVLAGMSGSGKSTTAAKIIEDINQNYGKAITTIEQPIEYLISHGKSMVKQKELGLDVLDHLSGIQSVILDDTDVLYIDDVMGDGVFDRVMNLAQKGSLVILSVNSKDVKSTLQYLIKSVEQSRDELMRLALADSLKAIVAHKKIDVENENSAPIYEILINTSAVKRIIVEDKLGHINKVMKMHRELGMITFDDALAEKNEKTSKDQTLHVQGHGSAVS